MRAPGLTPLIDREEQLADRFLEFSWTSKPNVSIRNDGLRAYTLLVHAEIETYLERVALALLDHAKIRSDKGEILGPLLCVLATYMGVNSDSEFTPGLDRIAPPAPGPWKTSKADWIDHCYKQMRLVITKNNGLKEANIRKMFGPMGLSMDELDTIWLASLDDLGVRRGTIAHNHIGLYTLKPPAEHRKLALDILKGIPDFIGKVKATY